MLKRLQYNLFRDPWKPIRNSKVNQGVRKQGNEQGKCWMCYRSISLLTNELFFFFKCSARKLSLGFIYDLKFNLRYLMDSTAASVFCSRHHLENLLHSVYIFCVFIQLKKMSSCKILLFAADLIISPLSFLVNAVSPSWWLLSCCQRWLRSFLNGKLKILTRLGYLGKLLFIFFFNKL